MSSSSSSQNEFSHRQGSVTSLPDEDDQITTASEPLPTVDEYTKVSELEDVQTASMDFQAVPDMNNEETSNNNQTVPRADSNDDLTTSLGFEQHAEQMESSVKVLSPTIDYETLVRTENLYYDPNPELIRKPQMITPIVYKQNIMIKFLKPPSIPLGPLIIREVRPPQPPPPPPLIIRQRPPPPLSAPPIILREKPPQAPALLKTQVLTKVLPPVPPPPRSVIIERLPPLPPKPRDIVIERWIPYEATTQRRQVIIQRAEEVKLPPPPRNLIIAYDKIEAKIVRQFQRHGVTPEDPEKYTARYRSFLFDTKDLLSKARELGITEDLSLPSFPGYESQEQFKSNSSEEKTILNNSSPSEKFSYNDLDNSKYAPTYANLMSTSSMNYDGWNETFVDEEKTGEDLSTQLAQYGFTAESIPD